MTVTLPDAIGFLGVAILVAAYVLLQTERISSQQYRYPAMNFAGAGLILISLFWAWNISAVIIEAIWMLISVFSIVAIWRKRRRQA